MPYDRAGVLGVVVMQGEGIRESSVWERLTRDGLVDREASSVVVRRRLLGKRTRREGVVRLGRPRLVEE